MQKIDWIIVIAISGILITLLFYAVSMRRLKQEKRRLLAQVRDQLQLQRLRDMEIDITEEESKGIE